MDLNYDELPFRQFPQDWEPLVRQLLQNIAGELTQEQQAAFVIEDLKEKWGTLRVSWRIDAPLNADKVQRIEQLVDQAEADSEALHCESPVRSAP